MLYTGLQIAFYLTLLLLLAWPLGLYMASGLTALARTTVPAA